MSTALCEPDAKSRSASHRRRVLFVAEAVTLAHAARAAVLAAALDPQRFEVHLACADRYDALLGDVPVTRHRIDSIPSAQFTNALARGKPIYDYAMLKRYVDADTQLLRELQPDVVVGDFRLSLAVSAPVMKVPHIAIANAYWSPFAQTQYPMPDHWLNRVIGRRAAGWLFNIVRPFVFARYAAPLNRLRRENGLPSLGRDLRSVYTHGDVTLYADVPEMFDLQNLPENHRFLGPVLWSPRIEAPAWWSEIPSDRPVIYVNLGSSGNGGLLGSILDALAHEPVFVIAATGGQAAPPRIPSNARLAPYLPGNQACAIAGLVICNGGAPSTQQALAAGRPVLGIPSNLDQCLNMQAVIACGAGRTLYAEQAAGDRLRSAIHDILQLPYIRGEASRLAMLIAEHDAALGCNQLFASLCDQLLAAGSAGG